MKQNHQNKIRIFRTLNQKFAFSFFILAVAILTSSCTIGYYVYRSNIEKLYNAQAYSTARQACAMTNGDALLEYLKNNEESGSYLKLKSDIETLRQNMDMIAIFIVQVNEPSQGNYRYILDTLASHAYENPLGTVTAYPAQYQKQIEAVYYDGADLSDTCIYVNSQAYGSNLFAIVPVRDSSGRIVADLFVQSGVEKIQETLNQYLTYAISITIVTVLILLLIFLSILNRYTVTPIRQLTQHASSFISGDDLSANLEKIHTGDEIETLADALNQMETDIGQYTENLAAATASKEHMAAELNIAKQIQQNLFPFQYPAFPGRKDFDIYACLRSCAAIGGNFYNFLLLDENHLCLFLGDASGNGFSTSMLTVIATTLIGNYAALQMTPGQILTNVNHELSKNNRAELTADAFAAIVDLSSGQLSYAAAGNSIHVLIKRPGRSFEELPYKDSFSLAALDQIRYPASQISLAQGDLLFLYTKGISEAVNEKGFVFGQDYARETISGLVQQEYSLKAILDAFFTSVSDFENGTAQDYDSTGLLFRYSGC